jgi:excisionase family DNA binding protein
MRVDMHVTSVAPAVSEGVVADTRNRRAHRWGYDTQPYVNLAVAVLHLAVSDAYSPRTARCPGLRAPTAADVLEAREFLLSDGAAELAELLGLDRGICRRVLAEHPPAEVSLEEDGWLSVEETAARFGYHPERVRQLIRAGRIQAVKRSDGWSWRVDPRSVDAYRDSLHF